jgi:hypothetical protein
MRNDDSSRGSGPFEKVGETMGGMAGRAAGQATDMAMHALGNMVGAAVNVLGDWWASDSAREAARSFGEEKDSDCRSHFERSSSASSRTYESTRPLYQFGHVAGQNPDYQGRSFQEVEPELQKAWGDDQSNRYGEWPTVRGYVGFGFGDPNADEPLA